MALTNEQVPILKAAILAETDPTFVAFRTAGSTGAMAAYFNTPSTFVVWKTNLSEHTITGEVSSEGTVWSWPAYIARSMSEQNGWARMFNGTYTINPSLPQVRTGVADIFSGGTGAAQRTHLLAIAKRFASRGEAIYAAGIGSVATPGTLVFEGGIGEYDVVRALYQ